MEGWSDAWEGFYSLSREYTWSFVFNGNFSFSLSFSPNFFPQLSRNSFPPLFSSRCTFHFFGKCQVNNTRRKWMKNWKNGIYFYFPALKLKDPIRNVLFFCNWWVNFLPKYLSYKFFFFTVSREESNFFFFISFPLSIFVLSNKKERERESHIICDFFFSNGKCDFYLNRYLRLSLFVLKIKKNDIKIIYYRYYYYYYYYWSFIVNWKKKKKRNHIDTCKIMWSEFFLILII